MYNTLHTPDQATGTTGTGQRILGLQDELQNGSWILGLQEELHDNPLDLRLTGGATWIVPLILGLQEELQTSS
jgi:hypothetical protein